MLQQTARQTPLILDALAWQEGFEAGRLGATLDDNPYDTDPERISVRGLSWSRGFKAWAAQQRAR